MNLEANPVIKIIFCLLRYELKGPAGFTVTSASQFTMSNIIGFALTVAIIHMQSTIINM